MPTRTLEQGMMNETLLAQLKQALIKEGLVSRENMTRAEEEAREENLSLRSRLVKLGFLTEEQLGKFIGRLFQIPYVNLRN
ncbi:MAG: hypothetical protein ACE5FY_06290, partial [Nitrospiria bacterium]